MENIKKIQLFIFIVLFSVSGNLMSQTLRDTVTLDHDQLLAGTYSYSGPTQMVSYTGWDLILNKVHYKIIIDLGEDYNLGSSAFDVIMDSLSVELGYTQFGTPTVLSNEVMALSLDESHPEIHVLLGTLNTSFFDNYSIDLNFGGYNCPSGLTEHIQFKIIRTLDIYSVPSGIGNSVRLEAPTSLEGKKHFFSWDLGSTPPPLSNPTYYNTGHFQFQLMKLYNTSEAFAIDETGSYTVDVDWSKALDLEINSFDRELILSLTEGSGYYIWRVRAIGVKYDGGITNPKNWGGWSDHGTYTNGAEDKTISAGGTSPYLFYYTENEDSINWIYKRAFAEGSTKKEGKGIRIGENMAYANGLQQVVQNQSYQDTKDTVMAQGIYYDYAAREALQTMSVPAKQNHLQYKPNLMYNSNLTVYSVTDFDANDNFNDPNAVESDTSSFGYYSVNNTTDFYVPDAEGYPFNRTLFYSGTGKMRETGSAAETHRIKPDSIRHTIRKFYSGVADPELIKVFGKEAPDGKLVNKEITIDQNNVASVTYTDHNGKTIATCLANNPEVNEALLAIPSAIEPPDSTSTKVKNGVLNGNLIVDENNLYLFDTTQVLFEYKFTPQELQDTCIDFCKTCDYIVHRYLLEVGSDSIWFESTDTLNPAACPAGLLLDEDSTMSLLPGDYLMVREVWVNNTNPTSGDLYLTEHLNAIEQAYEDTFQVIYDLYQDFIDDNDLIGFYDSINPAVDVVVMDPSVFYDADSVLTIPFGDCDVIEVPIQVCPASPCELDTFEIYGNLIVEVLGAGFIDTIWAGTNPYYYYPTSYDTLIDNMINDLVDDYNCDTLWDIWQSTVYTYENIRNSCIDQDLEVPTLLSLFLDGTRRRINTFKTDYTDLKYNEYAYMYLPNGWSCDLDCAESFVDTMDVFEDHITGSATQSCGSSPAVIHYEDYDAYLWELFYLCVTSLDPDAEVEDPVELCEERCESRRGGFKDDLRQLIYRNSDGGEYVEGDEFGTVNDTLWHTGPYYIYNQSIDVSTLDLGMSSEELECYTNALVNNCMDYCQLYYTTTPSGERVYTSDMDSLAEFAKAMIYDYEIEFLDSDSLQYWSDYDTVNTANIYCEPQHRDSVEVIWDSIYGGSRIEYASKIIQTKDGGYLLIGSMADNSAPRNYTDISPLPRSEYDYWAVKLKTDYTKDWDHFYTGNNTDILVDAIEMPDGGYVLAGYSNSTKTTSDYDFAVSSPNGLYDYWVIKIDADGDKEWQNTYGTGKDERLTSMLLLKDGNIVLGGYYTSGTSDYYVVKINSDNGNQIWDDFYKSAGSGNDYLYSMYEDHKHNILLAGASDGGVGNDKNDICRGDLDYWVINIDSDDHSIIWQKTIGGDKDDIATSIIEDRNQNIVIAGYSISTQGTGEHTAINYGDGDAWVVKLLPTPEHNILWNKSYGSAEIEGFALDSLGYQTHKVGIVETRADNYLISTSAESDPGTATDTRTHFRSVTGITGWLVYTDSDGEYIWDRLMGGKALVGAFEHLLQSKDYSFSAIYTSDQYAGSYGGGEMVEKSWNAFDHSGEEAYDYWAVQFGHECDSMVIAFRWTDTLSLAPQIDTINVAGISCEEASMEAVMNNIYDQKDQIIAQKLQEFEDQYQTDCTLPVSLDDLWEAKYEIAYHHYTLYYYDRMGRLIKTVPPAGVEKSTDLINRTVVPDHRLVTKYEYNSLGQLIKQHTPDGGGTNFYYNQLGQQRFSVNAQQKEDQTFSYTKYDVLGRVVEVGLADSTSNYLEQNNINSLTYPTTGLNEQIFTVYSTAHPSIKGIDGSDQNFILNRVSYTYSYTASGDSVQTVYSYDPHGNVEWLVQDLPGLGAQYVNYSYDLLSGNVLEIAYNKGRTDQFFHRYNYDADNRLILTESSYDGEIWDKDAAYEYYLHGPLRRTALGEDKIQGLDYTYTIHGWLKTLNNPSMVLANDPGQDGATGSNFAGDVYAQALGYYDGDYRSDAYSASGGFGTGLVEKSATTNNELFNGNIATWTNNTFIENGDGFPEYNNEATAFTYRYDQLQRIKESHFFSGTGLSTNDGAYDIVASYDANGNLELLDRKAVNLTGNGLMDQLEYTYQENAAGKIVKNRLLSVEDLAVNNAYGDIEYGTLTYAYDSIGNLISNLAEGIDTIKWTAYGKVAEVIKVNASYGPNLRFTYDASGHRVMKEIINSTSDPLQNEITYYIRDAQGNILSSYKQTQEVDRLVYHLKEQAIYGSSRLGLRQSNLEVKSVINPGTEDEFMALSNQHTRKSENELMALPYAKAETAIGSGFSITQQLLSLNSSISSHSALQYKLGQIQYQVEQESVSEVGNIEGGKILNNVAVSENKDGQTGIIAMSFQDDFQPAPGAFWERTFVLDQYGNLASGSNTIKSGYRNASMAIEATQGSDKQFLFTTKDEKAYYTVITKSGAVFSAATSVQLSSDTTGFGKKMAVMADYTQNKALYLRRYDDGKSYIHSYEIGSTTVQAMGIKDSFRSSDPSGEGDMQISTDGKWLAVANRYGGSALSSDSTEIRLYKIHEDRTEISFEDSIVLADEYVRNFDFSPENDYIYFSGTVSGTWKLKRIDMSDHTVETLFNNNSSVVRRGKDGRIYYGYNGASKLYYIENPDAATLDLTPPDDDLGEVVLETDANWKHTGGIPLQPHLIYEYEPDFYVRELGNKYYELTDHLGNVRAVIKDTKDSGTIATFDAYVTTATDFYPFGMQMPGRYISSSDYKFGFNSMEKIDEWDQVAGSKLDFGARIYDSRIGKWLAVDPLASKYPDMTPYQFCANNTILFVDQDGREVILSFTSKKAQDSYLEVVNSGLEGEYKAVLTYIGDNKYELKFSEISKDSKGNVENMTPNGKAFFNHMSDMIESEKSVKMTVTYANPRVMVGKYATGELDMADVESFNRTGHDIEESVGATQIGKIVHETKEQFVKQSNGYSDNPMSSGYKASHRAGTRAENDVNGNTRNSDDQGVRGMYTYTITNKDGSVIRVRYNGNNAKLEVTQPKPRTKMRGAKVKNNVRVLK